jgi:hypothetical protein
MIVRLSGQAHSAALAQPRLSSSARMAGHVSALLNELELPQYLGCFEEEDLTEVSLLRDIARRPDALRSILKEIGVAKIGHRERLVNAVLASQQQQQQQQDDSGAGASASGLATPEPEPEPESAEALATRQALGLSRGIVAGGLALTATAQRPAWQETAAPDDDEEADGLGHLDQRLGSLVAAMLASSLGSVGAREVKVQALLRHGWVPRLVSTLSAAAEAAAAELTKAQAERTAAEAARAAERAAAAAAAEAAAQSGAEAAEAAETEPGASAVASIDDVDDFELRTDGRADRSIAVAQGERSGEAAAVTVLLQETTAGGGSSGGRSWRIGAERHWSLAELRSAAEAPDLLGAAPFRFCSPTAVTEYVDPKDETTVPLSVMRAPISVVLGPPSAAHQQVSADALSEVVSTRLAAAVVVRREVGIPARPRWTAPKVVGEAHPSVEGHTATQTSDGVIWVFGGIEVRTTSIIPRCHVDSMADGSIAEESILSLAVMTVNYFSLSSK